MHRNDPKQTQSLHIHAATVLQHTSFLNSLDAPMDGGMFQTILRVVVMLVDEGGSSEREHLAPALHTVPTTQSKTRFYPKAAP